MSVGHTPGPWDARPDETDNGEWEVVKYDASKYTVAEPWYICACFDKADSASAEANARLIAAAPDLLEALHGLFGYASAPLDDRDMSGRGVAWRAARAAIAKATGK